MRTVCLAPNGPAVRRSQRSADQVITRKNSGVRSCPLPVHASRLTQVLYERSPLFAMSSPPVDRKTRLPFGGRRRPWPSNGRRR